MEYEWDENKNTANKIKHGVDFEAAYDFEWQSARIAEDMRVDYGEKRMIAQGFITDRLHIMTFTMRDNIIRVISLRKSNRREQRRFYDA